jgi:hypothetical protein
MTVADRQTRMTGHTLAPGIHDGENPNPGRLRRPPPKKDRRPCKKFPRLPVPVFEKRHFARQREYGSMQVEDVPPATSPILTDHARERAQVRGVPIRIVEAIYANADRSPFVGSGPVRTVGMFTVMIALLLGLTTSTTPSMRSRSAAGMVSANRSSCRRLTMSDRRFGLGRAPCRITRCCGAFYVRNRRARKTCLTRPCYRARAFGVRWRAGDALPSTHGSAAPGCRRRENVSVGP